MVTRMLAVLIGLFALTYVSFAKVYRVSIQKDSLGIPVQNNFTNGEIMLTEKAPVVTRKHHNSFVGYVYVGEPHAACNFCEANDMKPYLVRFDTRYGDTWLFSSKVAAMLTDNFPHNFYDKIRSSSYKDWSQDGEEDKTFEITYHDGTRYTGDMGFETVRIGGAMLKDAPFSYVTNMNDLAKVSGTHMDGVFGLGLDKKSSKYGSEPTFIQMAKAGRFDEPIFSFYFSNNGHDGVVMFGGTDEKLYLGSIKYHSLVKDSDTYWLLDVSAVRVGTRIVSSGMGVVASMNTGDEAITAPSGVVDMIRQLSKAKWLDKSHTIATLSDCAERHALPNLDFVIGTEVYSFSGAEYFREDLPGKCNLFIRPTVTSEVWGFGRRFFEKYYAAFNYETREVGFARASHKKLRLYERN